MEDPGRACSGVDNLSKLPDELLSRILSLLCTEDAVRTSVLSTRWRYLYTSISSFTLDFNSEVLKITDEQDCMDFVDRLLFHRKNCALDKFELKWNMSQALDPLRLENWIKDVFFGHGIRELDLCIYDFELKDLVLPSSLFTSKTLEVLKLSVCLRSNYSSTESEARGYGLELPAKVCLPSLRSIHLENVRFSEDSWSKLFLNCPILEEFLLSFSWGRDDFKLVVSSPTLKRLTIDLKSGCFDVVIVDAPSLVSLGFSIGYTKSLMFVNAQSLVEADIGIFRYRGGLSSFINVSNELMRGIRNIQKLRICDPTLFLFKISNVSIPMLHNMIHLTMYGCGRGLDFLPNLLEKCESLETLVLEDLCVWHSDVWNNVEESRISCLSSAVKTIKICQFKGEEHEVEMVKYFLETAKVLELIEIHLGPECRNPSEITIKLQMLPKNSEALMNIIV